MFYALFLALTVYSNKNLMINKNSDDTFISMTEFKIKYLEKQTHTTMVPCNFYKTFAEKTFIRSL